MRFLIINGPNINMLGIREPQIYGKDTYEDLISFCKKVAEDKKVEVECFQSNHEGEIIDEIQYATELLPYIRPTVYMTALLLILPAIHIQA